MIEKNRWQHLDLACLPGKLHHRPELIPEAVRDKIRQKKDHYDKIYVLYGDCGTGGALDRVLAQEGGEAGGIERISGPHCFSFYQGNQSFEAYSETEITTFFLTDYFCRHFEKFVWQTLGLDRRPDMKDFVFAHYEKLVYQAQVVDRDLEGKAQEIAGRLGLKYEYRFVGFGEMATFLAHKPGRPG
ncbi:MAG: DUF1638 domain-containing protein [Pseudomonadota bacterium]